MRSVPKTTLQTVFGKRSFEKARSSYYGIRRWVKKRYRGVKSRYYWVRKHGLRYNSVYPYTCVQGGFPEDHAIALYDVAKSLPNDGPVLVEIGSWLGRSAVVLSRAIRDKNGATLFCIDPFNADSDSVSSANLRRASQKIGRTLMDLFTENLRRFGASERVKILRGYSSEFSGDWDKPIDLLFIDGNHAYEPVKRDFLEWSPFIKPGGYLIMHDASFDPQFRFPDPIKVVKEFIIDNSQWVDHKLIRHMFIARKAPDRSPTVPL